MNYVQYFWNSYIYLKRVLLSQLKLCLEITDNWSFGILMLCLCSLILVMMALMVSQMYVEEDKSWEDLPLA